MTLQERIAWLHRDATLLATHDHVELKNALKTLIEHATVALEITRKELSASNRNKLHHQQKA